MFVILSVAFVIGGIVGWIKATKRGGNLLDKLQYFAAHGIVFLLLALILTLIGLATGILA